jgi:hypothetical protein
MTGMESVIFWGHAELDGDSFDFKIGPWSHRIGLLVRRTNHLGSTETGAGLWDSIDKAKDISAEIVQRGLGPHCVISWHEIAY